MTARDLVISSLEKKIISDDLFVCSFSRSRDSMSFHAQRGRSTTYQNLYANVEPLFPYGGAPSRVCNRTVSAMDGDVEAARTDDKDDGQRLIALALLLRCTRERGHVCYTNNTGRARAWTIMSSTLLR